MQSLNVTLSASDRRIGMDAGLTKPWRGPEALCGGGGGIKASCLQRGVGIVQEDESRAHTGLSPKERPGSGFQQRDAQRHEDVERRNLMLLNASLLGNSGCSQSASSLLV